MRTEGDIVAIYGGNGSKFNMYKDRKTGEIILIGIKTAKEIFTEIFVK